MMLSAARAIIAAGVLASAAGSCGSSASSGDYALLCPQACNMAGACLADAGTQIALSSCVAQCASNACANQNAIAAVFQTCLSLQSCDAFESCINTRVPICISDSGVTGDAAAGGDAGRADAAGD
jgi:hypothetical protein